jgi:mannitol/fructose-specific phosphotransferase system IIA component (Ntr-type)
VRLVEIIPREAIVTELRADDRDSAIIELLEALERSSKLKPEHREDIILALLKREAVASTALGHGVAIPHAKTKQVPDFCGALGIAREGIDFSAQDGMLVTVIFLFLSPEHAISGHLQLMAHIAGLARNARYLSLLRSARNLTEIDALLQDCEKILFGPPESL